VDVQKNIGLKKDVKRADFIQYWRRSRLKNVDKLKIVTKKNVRNHLCQKFCLVLAKIQINRVLFENEKLTQHIMLIINHKCSGIQTMRIQSI